VSYFGVTVFLFSCCSLVVYPSLLEGLLRDRRGAEALAPLGALGRYAFAIYLVHMPFFVGYVTGELVSPLPLRDDYWRLMHGIFVVGLLTSLAFVVSVASLFPRLGEAILGVERRQQPPPPDTSPRPRPGTGSPHGYRASEGTRAAALGRLPSPAPPDRGQG
jgi:peptidoglycan/LPS O-acetylase OafA/YrhL